MDKTIATDKGKFLKEMQNKHNTKEKDSKDLIGTGLDVKDLDYVGMPKKIHVTSQVGETSVKDDKPRLNPLHGGNKE